MTFRREVHHCIGFVLSKNPIHGLTVTNVSMLKKVSTAFSDVDQ